MSSEDDESSLEPGIHALPSGVLSHVLGLLGPRDLAYSSCVCSLWRHVVRIDHNRAWRSFYLSRWQQPGLPCGSSTLASSPPAAGRAATLAAPPPASCAAPAAPAVAPAAAPAALQPLPSDSSFLQPPAMRWQSEYGIKMLRLRSWAGRYNADQLVGHKSAVRAARLLPTHNLLATASLDRTVRLWDLASGLPLAASRLHGGTVRCLALDPHLLASGSSDAVVRAWHPSAAAAGAGGAGAGGAGSGVGAGGASAGVGAGAGGAAPALLFDIASSPALLRGHTGPVSCLALGSPDMGAGGGGKEAAQYGQYGSGQYGNGLMFSGSWDCTVRIWRRDEDALAQQLQRQLEQMDEQEGGEDGGSDGTSTEELLAPLTLTSGSSSSSSGSGGSGGSSGSGDEGGRRRGVGAGRRRGAAGGKAVWHERDEAGGWRCRGVLQYGDWVFCCVARGANLLVAAGAEVVVTDAATGRSVRRFKDLHEAGSVAAVEGTRSGRLLFTASADGLVLAHDLRMKQGSRVLWHHHAAVTGLALEDPWLASSSADGTIILQDVHTALGYPGSSASSSASTPRGGAAGCGASLPPALGPACRALHCPSGQPALCLDMVDEWLTAGTENGTVRLWDFTGAAAAAERAAASRAARSSAKAARAAARQPHTQHAQHRHAGMGAQHAPPPGAPAAAAASASGSPPAGVCPASGAGNGGGSSRATSGAVPPAPPPAPASAPIPVPSPAPVPAVAQGPTAGSSPDAFSPPAGGSSRRGRHRHRSQQQQQQQPPPPPSPAHSPPMHTPHAHPGLWAPPLPRDAPRGPPRPTSASAAHLLPPSFRYVRTGAGSAQQQQQQRPQRGLAVLGQVAQGQGQQLVGTAAAAAGAAGGGGVASGGEGAAAAAAQGAADASGRGSGGGAWQQAGGDGRRGSGAARASVVHAAGEVVLAGGGCVELEGPAGQRHGRRGGKGRSRGRKAAGGGGGAQVAQAEQV